MMKRVISLVLLCSVAFGTVFADEAPTKKIVRKKAPVAAAPSAPAKRPQAQAVTTTTTTTVVVDAPATEASGNTATPKADRTAPVTVQTTVVIPTAEEILAQQAEASAVQNTLPVLSSQDNTTYTSYYDYEEYAEPYEGHAFGGDFSIMPKLLVKDQTFPMDMKNYGGGGFVEGVTGKGALYGLRVGYNTLEGTRVISTTVYGGFFIPFKSGRSSAFGLRLTAGVGVGLYSTGTNEAGESQISSIPEAQATLGLSFQLGRTLRLGVDAVYDYLHVNVDDSPSYGQLGGRAQLALVF